MAGGENGLVRGEGSSMRRLQSRPDCLCQMERDLRLNRLSFGRFS